MVVPVIQEQVKNKELLIEVDSIVTDNKDLANVSLSSNDSLSKSRRKWRLIRIINKLNPALAERKYEFPARKFFFALFLIIVTSMIIYWSLAPRSVGNSKPDCPSSIPLKSSTPEPVHPSPTPQVSPRIPTKLLPFTPLKALQSPPLQILPSIPLKVQEDSTIETPDGLDFMFPFPAPEDFGFEPSNNEEMLMDYPGSEDMSLFEFPDSEEFMFKFPDSLTDLSDTFALRSSGVNSDLVLKSVDKFINFFKSMINF